MKLLINSHTPNVKICTGQKLCHFFRSVVWIYPESEAISPNSSVPGWSVHVGKCSMIPVTEPARLLI